jgi:tetratricopeptide (TPR) repeat protein
MSLVRVLLIFPFLFTQGIVLDRTQVQFYETMELASAEGIPTWLLELDNLVKSSPSSPFVPHIQETILITGLLHPGSVPDWSSRFASLKSSASANPLASKVLKRLEILKAYYSDAAEGRAEKAALTLSDPVFEGSPYGIQARADAALRAQDYKKALMLAMRVIENDPYSPLLANAYMVLGLAATYQGDNTSALTYFRKALATCELPTVYGNPRDFVFAAYRFSRAVPSVVGDIYDKVESTHLEADLKEPQAMIFGDNRFVLLDKEMLLTVSPAGKILDKKPVRKIEDVAPAGNGRLYSITEDRIDLGNGNTATLSMTVGKKTKRVHKLRSIAMGIGGDLFLLDEDAGLLRGTAAVQGDSLPLSSIAPIEGRLVRTDSWGNAYVLDKDKKSIRVFTRDGKSLTSISAAPVESKAESIDYFALDSLNAVYLLASNSVQVYVMKHGKTGIERKRICLFVFNDRPQLRNLKVLGVTPDGEMVVTGKNENNWVCFR